MIPADIIKKIRRVHIKSRRTVNNLMAGQYRSVFRGSGIEFEEVREYCPGDEVKSIDWKVSARLGKPFIKRYREERESILLLLVDMSASLKFGTFSGPKLEKVAELASVLAFNAIKNNDKVGVIFFTDQVEKYIPPKKGSAHIWRVIKEIFTFVPQGKGTDIGAALDFMSRISKKRSFVFILSDFLGKGYETPLKIARKKHEPIGIRIFDENAFHLPVKGIVRVSDFETGQVLVFDAFDRRTRDGFLRIKQEIHQETQDIFSKAKTDLVNLKTSDSVSDTLTHYFRLRERRFR
ncbi:MAG: DUF58 domain-containing protein [Proteobacteria bacterium]|nr:DUF58 domain-containing protein [Desulfobacula sp.]MBU3953630.1 DUF58 domain-containing protein [Pseudomonadota bacterium]MBU4129847.1 DUF58 domain-containing protein [Pseudomonadota bacterium]